MKIAVDKNTINEVKLNNNYIYLFDDEPLEVLLNTGLHCIYYKHCNFVDINLTDYNVNCIKKAKVTDKDWNILPKKVNYKIGIIIPNYNYEHTIEKCLNSILNQTYKNYKVYIIDDGSNDITKNYLNEHFWNHEDQ